jgi:GTP-binding protein EngB required for normal cell division
VLVLATKIDKLNVAKGRDAIASIRASIRDRFGEAGGRVAIVGFSATTRRGLVEADEIMRGWLA